MKRFVSRYTRKEQPLKQHQQHVEHVQNITEMKSALQFQELPKVPKLVLFYASWCGPCRNLKSLLNQKSLFTDENKLPLIAFNIDDQQVYKDLAFPPVQSVPTLYLVDGDNKIIKQNVGTVTKEQLLDFIKTN